MTARPFDTQADVDRWINRLRLLGLTELEILEISNLAFQLQKDTAKDAATFAIAAQEWIEHGGTHAEAVTAMRRLCR